MLMKYFRILNAESASLLLIVIIAIEYQFVINSLVVPNLLVGDKVVDTLF